MEVEKFLKQIGYIKAKTPCKIVIGNSEVVISINKRKKILKIGESIFDLIKIAGLVEADKTAPNIEERVSLIRFLNVESMIDFLNEQKPLAIIYNGDLFVLKVR